MMKFKLLLATTLMSLSLLACSEGGYVAPVVSPATAVPYNNVNGIYNPTGLNNGIYGNPLNNSLANPLYNPLLASNYNFQARSNSSFYYSRSASGSCIFRTTPSCTSNSCACYRTSCNCKSILEQIDADQKERLAKCRTCTKKTESTTSSSGDANADVSTGILKNVRLVTIKGTDARALYERLAVKSDNEDIDTTSPDNSVTGKKDGKTHAVTSRVGNNYKCWAGGQGANDSDYECDLDINTDDGSVFAWSNPGDSDKAELSPSIYVNQPNKDAGTSYLEIGSLSGEGISNATYTITGTPAHSLYNRMKAIDPETNAKTPEGVAASARKGSNIVCFQQNDSYQTSECVIGLKTDTGEAITL